VYLPASQSTQLTAAVLEYLPDVQPVHAWSPGLPLNLPGSQAVQFCFVPNQPALHEQLAIDTQPASKMEFTGHEMHSDLSSAEYLPAPQYTQVTADVLEYLPVTQLVHASAPSLALNLPGTQPLHSPFAPDHPTLQEQLEIVALPSREFVFIGHMTQSDLSSAVYLPASHFVHVLVNPKKYSENVPTAQSMHSADPILFLYLPDTQLAQSPITPDQSALFAGHAIQYEAAMLKSAYSPIAQALHGIDPLWPLYLPATQAVQSLFVPVQPTLHSHSVVALGASELGGQVSQSVLPFFNL